MRRKEYFGSLRERDGYLVVVALRCAEQMVSARDLPRPAGRDPDPREIAMAEQLISVLESDFVAEDFHDDYRDRVMKFIEQGRKVRSRSWRHCRSRRARRSCCTRSRRA